MKYLQNVPIHKDDLFFIPAGTIHAIGAGALVAEIQESSNLTYRLYDYDRIGKDGKKRELHIDKALDVADLHGSAEPTHASAPPSACPPACLGRPSHPRSTPRCYACCGSGSALPPSPRVVPALRFHPAAPHSGKHSNLGSILKDVTLLPNFKH